MTSYGGQIITITDTENENSCSLTVFVEGEIPIEFGDAIQAEGTIQKYEGEWELVVTNEQHITIIEKWHNVSMPLWQLAQYPAKYTGMNVNISGIIDRYYDGYLYLIDAEGTYSIAVYYDTSQMYNASQGDIVNICARFSYDEETLRYVLLATEDIHSIKKRIEE